MERIGPYRIDGELARGGAGVVYRARDTTGRPVAIKLLLARRRADEGAQRRFQREAQALARLRHPHVVTIHACGESEHGPYLVLDLVQGQSLAERLLQRGRLEPEQAARIGLALAEALDHVHQAGVIHRDIKPANVLLDERDVPRLTDFGLARDLDPELDSGRLSRTGIFMGTPGYWPPEQAQGDLERIGPRSDVFALGATLYEMLAGTAPFAGETLAQALARLREPAPPLRPSQPDVPAGLEAICLRCLELDPVDRYPTARALAADLNAFLTGERPRALAQRQVARSWGPALGLVALGLLGAVAVLVARSTPAPTASPLATSRPARASASQEPPALAPDAVRALIEARTQPRQALAAAVDLLAAGEDPVEAAALIEQAAVAAWSPRPSWQDAFRGALSRIDGLRAPRRLAAQHAVAALCVGVGDYDKALRRLEAPSRPLEAALRVLADFALVHEEDGAFASWRATRPPLELAQAARQLVAQRRGGDPVAWLVLQQLLHGIATLGLVSHVDTSGLELALQADLRWGGAAGNEIVLAALGPAAFRGRTFAGQGDWENVFLERDPSRLAPEFFEDPQLGADFQLALWVHRAVHDPAEGAPRYLAQREALAPDLTIWRPGERVRFASAVISGVVRHVWAGGDPTLLSLTPAVAAPWADMVPERETDAWRELALLAASARVYAGEADAAEAWARRLTDEGFTNQAELVRAEVELAQGRVEDGLRRLETLGWVQPISQRAQLHARALLGETLDEHAFARVESLRGEHAGMFPWHAQDAEAVVTGRRGWPGQGAGAR